MNIWNWVNYKILAIKNDMFPQEHILNMLADLHERLSKLEAAELTLSPDLAEPSAYCVDCGGSEYHSETCGHYEPPSG